MDTPLGIANFFSKNTKYLKYVSIGILAYSAYHFLRMRNNKQKKNNKKEINNKNEISIPEHVKYDNGWYAELDEIIQKKLTMPAAAEQTLSEPPPTIQEVTPRGEILMYYDIKNKAFEYYSNNKNLPYKTLDAVARKYVCLHNVPSIYVDIREEVKKGLDKYNNQTNNNNSNVIDKKTSPSSSIYAVYKNYKSGIKTQANNSSTIGNNSDSKTNSKKIILKDNVNKFIFKGWINDYALDVKAREKKEKSSTKINMLEKHHDDHNHHSQEKEEKEEKEEINISYAEFKKKRMS